MEPLSLMMIAATATQAVGSIAQGEQQASQMNQQARAADYNAKVSDVQARHAFDAGTQNELTQRRRNAQLAGQTRAAVGESGFVGNTGSALAIQEQSIRDMELDALQQRYQGLLQGKGHEQEGVMQRYTAKSLRSSAKSARRGGYLSAAGNLLSGAAGIGALGAAKGAGLGSGLRSGSGLGLRVGPASQYWG